MAPVHKSTLGVPSVKKSSMPFSFEKCAVKSSMARLRAPMTFKFGEVASFVVKNNSYYALPPASTSRIYNKDKTLVKC